MRAITLPVLVACLPVVVGPVVVAAQPKGKPPKQVQIVNDPLVVSSASATRFQLVGFTPATFAGDAGVLGMSRGCAAEFPGSRLCSSVEVMETVGGPDLTGRPRAWVRPVLVLSTPNSAVDASGFDGQVNAFSCVGWTFATGGNSGLTVSAEGGFFAEASAARGACDVARPVSCCAAIP
jgi:hypothetical protein